MQNTMSKSALTEDAMYTSLMQETVLPLDGTTLSPCPFCGSEKIYVHEHGNSNWYVQCSDCFGAMLYHHTKAEAIIAWNTRTEKRI